jgi:tetratricopeptide (TPR) repeat protein
MTQRILTYRLLRDFAKADRLADSAIAMFPEAADPFWNEKGFAALGRGDVERAQAAAAKISGNGFPGLRFYVLYYGHRFAEAEAVSLLVWQGKEVDLVRYFALSSALAARAAGATERMRSFLLTARQSYEPLLAGEPDPGNLSWAGVLDAGLGRNEQAFAECRKAVELQAISRDALEGPEYVKNLALVYAWTGNRDRAIEQLSTLVKLPHGPTFGELKLDPMWDALRDDPRFAQLMAEAAEPAVLN